MRHLRRIVKSFAFAFQGIDYLLRTQSNFWVHLMAALLAVVLGLLLGSSGAELAALALAIGLVLVLEALNTALEALVDLVTPEFHPLARTAKDVSAAAVLLAAATAAVVGLVVLLPKLLGLLRA
jgi:diacylglycerol kinase